MFKRKRGRPKKKKTKITTPFPRVRGRKTELKLYFWTAQEMSKDGYMQFSKKIRHKMSRTVYRPFLRVDVPVVEIDSKKTIAEFSEEVIGQTGTFIMRGGSGGKTKYHFKWVRLAVIQIRYVKGELKAYVFPTFRMKRYWFWQDG